MQITWFGSGMIGTQMVLRLLNGGHRVTACVRRGEHSEITEAGGTITLDPYETASTSEMIGVCVYSEDQVRDLLMGETRLLARLRPGTVVLNHTTCSPELIEMICAVAPEGVEIVDAPFSGSAGEAATGHLSVLAGGATASFEMIYSAMQCYADKIFLVGSPGAGQRLKLVNNALNAANLMLAIRALEVLKEQGIDQLQAAKVLEHCSGGSWAMKRLAAAPSAAEFVQLARPYLEKDVSYLRMMAEKEGLELGVLGDVADLVFAGG